MSWLNPEADRGLVEELRRAAPGLHALALRLAPALRIEPLLLRNTRRRFLPRSSANLEADFWFGALIGSRSARSVVMRHGVARLLTDELVAKPGEYQETVAFIHDHTRHWVWSDRLEQDLRLAAREGNQAGLETGLRLALRHIATETDPHKRRDMARWAKGALPALPTGPDSPTEAAWLAQFTAATLGDLTGSLGSRGEPGRPLPAWLAAQVPEGQGFSVGLRLGTDQGRTVLEFADQAGDLPVLTFRSPPPSLLYVGCESNSAASPGWTPVWPGHCLELPPECSSLTLQTLDGRAWRLAADAGPTVPTDPGRSPARQVRLVHAPKDKGLARQVAKLLRKHGITAKPSPAGRRDSPRQAVPVKGDPSTPVVALWTRNAADYLAPAGWPIESGSGGRDLLLRFDEATLPEGSPPPRSLDLRGWDGRAHSDAAKRLLAEVGLLLAPASSAGTDLDSVSRTARMSQRTFDVFLAHNSKDKPAVRELARALREKGLRVWLDEEQLRPGLPWQEALEEAIETIGAAAVLIGPDGMGPWEVREMRAFLNEFVERGVPVIPVLLNDAESKPKLPLFLKEYTWVDFRNTAFDEVLANLIWRITGKKPAQERNPTSATRVGGRQEPTGPRKPEPESPQSSAPLAFPTFVTVPAGSFRMGTSDEDIERLVRTTDWAKEANARGWFKDEQPQFELDLPAFQISKYPVTNAQYFEFLKGTSRETPSHWSGGEPPEDLAAHPVVNVSWHDAQAYCQWLTERLRTMGALARGHTIRLPSEAEWEKAARGTDGRDYPWGTDWDQERCNSAEGGSHKTTPVDRYSPKGDSPYGVCDMAGNVWEWTRSIWGSDWQEPAFSYPHDPDDGREDEQAGDEVVRVLRGGTFYDHRAIVRCAYRYSDDPFNRYRSIGFRVVTSPSSEL